MTTLQSKTIFPFMPTIVY